MPIHDWSRVPPGLFHEFHQSWSVRIKDALNAGLMPKGYYALVEQRVNGPEPDVVAIETGAAKRSGPRAGGAATLEQPKTRLVTRLASDAELYARKANRISIRHALGGVVAIIEIVSPGNKDTANAVRSFVQKSAAFLRAGVHLLVVDLFPPSARRDPQGIHKAIWDEFEDVPFDPPADKPLTLVSYAASPTLTAYIEPVAVGDGMPDMPLFIAPEQHVPVPLEATYQATWAVSPEPIRDLLAPA